NRNRRHRRAALLLYPGRRRCRGPSFAAPGWNTAAILVFDLRRKGASWGGGVVDCSPSTVYRTCVNSGRSRALLRAVPSPTISTGHGVVFTCQTACVKAPSAIGSLGYFSASSRNFGATAKWCL